MAQIAPRSGDFRDEALAIGREYGIAGPDTSLVVLETAAQYAKYNIEPPASDKTLHKQWLKLQPDPAAAKEKKERNESFWFASLKNEWNKRVEWHKDPVPQRKTPSSGLFGAFRRGNSDVEDGMVAAEASAGMPAPVSAASEERRFSRAPARPGNSAARAKHGGGSTPDQAASSPAAAQVKLAAWDPKTPYLDSLKDCASAHGGAGSPSDMLYRRYLELRKTYAASPAFFLDCAGFFFARGERTLAVRILSNLTEIRLEDPALLRTFAWRLREAGEYARAIATLRKVAELRPEEPHSFRDLALVLSERAKDVRCAADAEEAMALLVKTAFTPWTRQDAGSVALFAVEELNGLADWCAKTAWPEGKAPNIPEWDDAFKYLPDVDLRIVLSWDADNTDIDIHVLEPSGEEAYYRNRLTASGGLVSRDIVTGYGPEEYMQVKGQKGKYRVLTHYYGSSQQKLTGPATATATVYTDWGRPTEKRRILSLRLDKPKEKVAVGEIEFGR